MKQLLVDLPNELGQLLLDAADGFTYAPDLGYTVHWDTEKDGPLPAGFEAHVGYLKREGAALVQDAEEKAAHDAKKADEAKKEKDKGDRKAALDAIDLTKPLSQQDQELICRAWLAEQRGL
jgi:hypothetical protein